MDLCRCGHLIGQHLIVTMSLEQRQYCHVGINGHGDPVCQCMAIIPMTNVEYLEYKYEVKNR